MSFRNFYLTFSVILLTSCGGGGGGGAAPALLASIINSFVASISSVKIGGTAEISWSSSNSTSCTASGSWSGAKSTSGSETVTINDVGNSTFGLTCTGEGGTSSLSSLSIEGYREISGISVDGYVTGASIFIDENDNTELDGDESSTTSDNSGAFTLKHSNGVLISKGGKDLDSQIELEGLLMAASVNGHSDSNFLVTPVTTVAFLLPDSNIYNLLGIDSSIDISTTDPVANKGDGGINDFLYEKGNQLTVLALSLYNINKNLDSANAPNTTADAFLFISEEIKKLYDSSSTTVNIEDSVFISNVLENMITEYSLTVSDVNKSNTVDALSKLMPIISVKSSNDVTTAIIRFGISTLQTDIVTIANGTADATLISNYTTNLISYLATDQSVDQSDLVAGVVAFNDEISLDEDTIKVFYPTSNDSLGGSSSFTITTTNPSNGSVSIGSDAALTYSPNADFNGTDSFDYTVTQDGASSTSSVSITVLPINDSPVINVASTLSVNENSISVGNIGTSDVDNDTIVLSISGTDASSFELSSANDLTFITAPDFETKTSYSVSFSLTDGTETVTKAITINVKNLNDVSPVINSATSFTIAENSTDNIVTLEIVDPEGGTFSYTITGTDASSFAISNSGVLTFTSPPDYETKTSYSFSVTVSDGVNTSSKAFAITITDLAELPSSGYRVPTSIDVIETKE